MAQSEPCINILAAAKREREREGGCRVHEREWLMHGVTTVTAETTPRKTLPLLVSQLICDPLAKRHISIVKLPTIFSILKQQPAIFMYHNS